MDQRVGRPSYDVGIAPNGGVEYGLRVRLFKADDAEAARGLIQQHHSFTIFGGDALSERKLENHFKQILARPPNMIGLVAEWEKRPVGLMWASGSEYLLTEGSLIVSVNLLAVDLNLRPLRRAKIFLALATAAKQWAHSLGARHTFVHVTTGFRLKETHRLINAVGGKSVGGSYVL